MRNFISIFISSVLNLKHPYWKNRSQTIKVIKSFCLGCLIWLWPVFVLAYKLQLDLSSFSKIILKKITCCCNIFHKLADNWRFYVSWVMSQHFSQREHRLYTDWNQFECMSGVWHNALLTMHYSEEKEVFS